MNLTSQERRVILFLIVVALTGLGINLIAKHFSHIKITGYVSHSIGKIDINKASEEDFLDIPGIGIVLARRITDYRRQYGRFSDIIELKNIKGIGESKFEKVKDYFIIYPIDFNSSM